MDKPELTLDTAAIAADMIAHGLTPAVLFADTYEMHRLLRGTFMSNNNQTYALQYFRYFVDHGEEITLHTWFVDKHNPLIEEVWSTVKGQVMKLPIS